MKLTHEFMVSIEADEQITSERCGWLLNNLINIGLEDAADTIEAGIENQDATDVTNVNITSPQLIRSSHA